MNKVSSIKNWCKPRWLSKNQMWPVGEKGCTCLV